MLRPPQPLPESGCRPMLSLATEHRRAQGSFFKAEELWLQACSGAGGGGSRAVVWVSEGSCLQGRVSRRGEPLWASWAAPTLLDTIREPSSPRREPQAQELFWRRGLGAAVSPHAAGLTAHPQPGMELGWWRVSLLPAV